MTLFETLSRRIALDKMTRLKSKINKLDSEQRKLLIQNNQALIDEEFINNVKELIMSATEERLTDEEYERLKSVLFDDHGVSLHQVSEDVIENVIRQLCNNSVILRKHIAKEANCGAYDIRFLKSKENETKPVVFGYGYIFPNSKINYVIGNAQVVAGFEPYADESLTYVSGNLIGNSKEIVVDLQELKEVGGTVDLGGSIYLPSVERIGGDIIIDGNLIDLLYMPRLEKIGADSKILVVHKSKLGSKLNQVKELSSRLNIPVIEITEMEYKTYYDDKSFAGLKFEQPENETSLLLNEKLAKAQAKFNKLQEKHNISDDELVK